MEPKKPREAPSRPRISTQGLEHHNVSSTHSRVSHSASYAYTGKDATLPPTPSLTPDPPSSTWDKSATSPTKRKRADSPGDNDDVPLATQSKWRRVAASSLGSFSDNLGNMFAMAAEEHDKKLNNLGQRVDEAEMVTANHATMIASLEATVDLKPSLETVRKHISESTSHITSQQGNLATLTKGHASQLKDRPTKNEVLKLVADEQKFIQTDILHSPELKIKLTAVQDKCAKAANADFTSKMAKHRSDMDTEFSKWVDDYKTNLAPLQETVTTLQSAMATHGDRLLKLIDEAPTQESVKAIKDACDNLSKLVAYTIDSVKTDTVTVKQKFELVDSKCKIYKEGLLDHHDRLKGLKETQDNEITELKALKEALAESKETQNDEIKALKEALAKSEADWTERITKMQEQHDLERKATKNRLDVALNAMQQFMAESLATSKSTQQSVTAMTARNAADTIQLREDMEDRFETAMLATQESARCDSAAWNQALAASQTDTKAQIDKITRELQDMHSLDLCTEQRIETSKKTTAEALKTLHQRTTDLESAREVKTASDTSSAALQLLDARVTAIESVREAGVNAVESVRKAAQPAPTTSITATPEFRQLRYDVDTLILNRDTHDTTIANLRRNVDTLIEKREKNNTKISNLILRIEKLPALAPPPVAAPTAHPSPPNPSPTTPAPVQPHRSIATPFPGLSTQAAPAQPSNPPARQSQAVPTSPRAAQQYPRQNAHQRGPPQQPAGSTHRGYGSHYVPGARTRHSLPEVPVHSRVASSGTAFASSRRQG